MQQLAGGSDDAAIVIAVISMARSLRLRVVAEGVETLQELEFLCAHQCDEMQGYYFSAPVPAAQFAHLLGSGIPAAARAALLRNSPPRENAAPYRVHSFR